MSILQIVHRPLKLLGIRSMTSRRFWIAASLISFTSVTMIVVAVTSLHTATPAWWALIAAAVIGPGSLFWIWPRLRDQDPEIVALRAKLTLEQKQRFEQQKEFERVRLALQTELQFRAERLEERERDLASRFARFHEFLEYPLENVHAQKSTGQLQKLSEQDRTVRQLLEAEAERVYEKIRRNGYTVDHKVDVTAIREETLQLIQRVAKIYNPASQNPLLETSFDQLARAASRICLHVLVLLEQLPVNVQHYNANKLYGYMQKAITSYGVYQKASPWFTYLSRGLYAGRLFSGANPATLGVWWLATELGKRGSQKVVETMVDRQAIATLHDLVTVIGVEVAGIYGTGFRQRDAGWILGAELAELIHCFPMSGESLRNGLRQITALPLRSEYDRIYLYRCVADHRSVGLQLADPAMLSREEREAIARHLETFFTSHIHGATASSLKKWREGFEQRFDLRLMLEGIRTTKSDSEQHELQTALKSLAEFLQSVAGVSVTTAIQALDGLHVSARIPESTRSATIEAACQVAAGVSFEPPSLDPAAEITHEFLRDLATCCTVSERPDEHVEQLAAEVSRYFRRPPQEMQNLLEAAWRSRAKQHCCSASVGDHLSDGVARAFLELRQEHERLMFCYGNLSRMGGAAEEPLPNSWLLGLERTDQSYRRVIVTEIGREPRVLWESSCPLKTSRTRGMFLDDAGIAGGEWLEASVVNGPKVKLVVGGKLRGGRFHSYFRDLLAFSEPMPG